MVKAKGEVWENFRKSVSDKSVNCNFCERKFKVPNVTRLTLHLISDCPLCPIEIKKKVTDKRKILPVENTSQVPSTSSQPTLKSEPRAISTPIPEATSIIQPVSTAQPKLENFLRHVETFMLNGLPISTSNITPEENEKLNNLLAKAILISGTPSSIVEHPLWIEYFKLIRPSYKLPTRKLISTTLLDKIYKETYSDIKCQIDKANALHLQCHVVCPSTKNETTLKFLISMPEPVFVKSINVKKNHNELTEKFLSQEILKIIKSYGPDKFSVIVGDMESAKNIQKAFELVIVKYPHIIPIECAAQNVNLLFRDILQNIDSYKVLDKSIDAIKEIKKSQILTKLLNKLIEEYGCGEQLKLPNKTRWVSNVKTLSSLSNSQIAVQHLAADKVGHEKLSLNARKTLLNANFWKQLNELLNFLKPISDWILTLEGENNSIHLVYRAFEAIENNIRENVWLSSNKKVEILQIFNERRSKSVKPIHLAAHILDPKAPHLGLNSHLEATRFISELNAKLHLKNAFGELLEYRAKTGNWAKPCYWQQLDNIDPVTWWKGLFGSTEIIISVLKILTAPSSLTRGLPHLKKYSNKMLSSKFAKIQFISYNCYLRETI